MKTHTEGTHNKEFALDRERCTGERTRGLRKRAASSTTQDQAPRTNTGARASDRTTLGRSDEVDCFVDEIEAAPAFRDGTVVGGTEKNWDVRVYKVQLHPQATDRAHGGFGNGVNL